MTAVSVRRRTRVVALACAAIVAAIGARHELIGARHELEAIRARHQLRVGVKP
jgi:hypothetical protein